MSKLLFEKEYVPALVAEIENARSAISIFMFEWRMYEKSPGADVSKIFIALTRAVRRGVSVRAIIDRPADLTPFNAQGIKSKHYTDKKLMHAKCVCVDDKCMFIGSHNFTTSAFGANLEISVKLDDGEFAKQARETFDHLWLTLP